jgi:uncharacterized protein (TIGR02001 family)
MSIDIRSRGESRKVVRSTLTVLLCGCMAVASSAQAGTSGSVALTSDYIFRGVSQTNQKPAVQAGIEYAADSGFYAGAWGSNISWLSDLSSTAAPLSSSLELDLYGGYRGKFSDAVSYDVGLLYYAYPGSFPAGFNSADTTELYAGVTLAASDKLSLGAKYSYAATDLFGYVDSSGSGYLDFSATLALGTGWSVGAHAGKQWIEGNAAFEYTDWKLGVTKAFDNGFSLAAAWTDTDADDLLYTNPYGNTIADGTFAVTVTKAF